MSVKIAYLVLAHNMPDHLARLVRRLREDECKVFVHIDAKSDMAPFSAAVGDLVTFVAPRVAVYWGDYSMVEATQLLMREALSDPIGFDRLVLLSGADYPLQTAARIRAFFEARRDTEFIELVRMPNDRLGKPLSRLTEYRYRPTRWNRRDLSRRVLEALRLIGHTRDYRPHLNGLAPFGGAQWWALTRGASDYVLSFMEQETGIVDFFKNTFAPDETLFHTILGNSEFSFRASNTLTWTDWSAGGPNPATLNSAHAPKLRVLCQMTQDDYLDCQIFLFARKIRPDHFEAADLIDDLILR